MATVVTLNACGEAYKTVAQILDYWMEAEIPHSAEILDSLGRQIRVRVKPSYRSRCVDIALEALRAERWTSCAERMGAQHRILGFKAEQGSFLAVRIDIFEVEESPLRKFCNAIDCVMPKLAPRIALVGPDGVGKSTTLDCVQEWFAREAPFISVTVRRWRPWLLPALSELIGKKEPGADDPEQPPRRQPGNLHLLRLAYYSCDFLLGSFWMDRRDRSQPRIVIYDRCAMDMFVDPVRFALSSRRGTSLTAALSPKPYPLVFLTDDARRIYDRKSHLEEHEIREQLKTWHELTREDKIDAVIAVNSGKEQIATRILDLALSGILEANKANARNANAGAEPLTWIESILTGRTNMQDSKSSEFTTTAAPPRETASFLVVPGKSNPRFLLPDANRRVMAGSLRMYNAQISRARMARTLLQMGLRTGIAQPFLRGRLPLQAGSSVPDAAFPLREWLPSHIQDILGYGPLFCSVSLGTPGPHRKPVLHIMNDRGETVAYAKVGWNNESIQLVKNEELVLRTLEHSKFSNVILPRVIHAEAWHGLYLLLQSSVGPLGKSPQALDGRHVTFLIDLHRSLPGKGELPLPEARCVSELKQLGFYYYAHLVDCARIFCSTRAGNSEVPFGPIHGDFTPWNIRKCRRGILICDWEYAQFGGPAGWDMLHFLVSAGVLLRRQRAGTVYRALNEAGPIHECIQSYLEGVGVPKDLRTPIVVAYLAKHLTDQLLLHGPVVDGDDQLMRKAWAGLLSIMLYNE
ncbi:MAG: hypothetical protein JOY85_24125 [Acidobacteriaceae bacterium]|nr:hypothetical protein [Acidobacteriaceae bacterium]